MVWEIFMLLLAVALPLGWFIHALYRDIQRTVEVEHVKLSVEEWRRF